MASLEKMRRNKTTKAASIYDVAHESDVSVFTVSAVVNHKSHVGEKLRKRVEAAIRKLNYRPNLIARSLANQRTHTIGMIVPDIANPFFRWWCAAPRMPRSVTDTICCCATVTTRLRRKRNR